MDPCPEPEKTPELAQIGVDGEPIRAITFAGGGLDTAMQLGVIHALLVSRAKAPDVVVGASTGAVNAVALAEVLQAGKSIEEKVARFRQIYEGYRNAPGRLNLAFRPDFFQVDTQQPLEPLLLPIHHKTERDERAEAVVARAGLINLYNTLLALRVTFGTVARAIRRVLGLLQAGEQESWLRRWRDRLIEGFRGWMLLGQNLHLLSPIVPPALKALLRRGFKENRGATAAALIFQSGARRLLLHAVVRVASLFFLVALWLGGALLVATLIWLAGFAFVQLLPRAALAAPARLAAAFALGAAIMSFAYMLTVQERARVFRAALWTLTLFTGLLAVWSTLLGVPLAAALALIVRPPSFFPLNLWLWNGPWWLSWAVFCVGLLVVVCLTFWGRRSEYGRWLLAQYDLDESVFSRYPLRQLLTSLFDQSYYGEIDMKDVVERALSGNPKPPEGRLSEKRLDHYAAKRDPASKVASIHVLIAVADLAENKFQVLPPWWRVVDGLTAALAAPPLFPPFACDDAVRRRSSLFVDARIVSNDPTRPLFSYLRHSGLINANATMLELYSVAALPLSRPDLGEDEGKGNRPREYNELVDVTMRALELKRFRDAQLERRMTEVQTRAMPPGDSVLHTTLVEPTRPGEPLEPKDLFRSWIYAIEPEQPLRVNQRVIMQEDEATRRRIIAETVADGCRAALQVFLQPAIVTERDRLRGKKRDSSVEHRALGRHVSTLKCGAALRARDGTERPLPGSAAFIRSTVEPTAEDLVEHGPGLAEVCAHCALVRPAEAKAEPNKEDKKVLRVLENADLSQGKRPLPARGWPTDDDDKPVAYGPPERDGPPSTPAPPPPGWPEDRNGKLGKDRPTVSLLFSGGVFRGVFQVGVLNGLSEAHVVPDLVAGASVGSITAAMVTRTFMRGKGDDAASLRARRQQVLRLAAAYLAIDRLVLTDRFADFVRGVTVRAAQARFSIRDADQTFRRLDDAGAARFSRRLRRVVAGIERLTYISPFELRDLVEAIRLQQSGKGLELLREYAQEWLDRVGVGDEVLGSEPLALLISEYVLEGQPRSGQSVEGFEEFANKQIVFLATTTDLTNGSLRILGKADGTLPGSANPGLLEGLLASSAFPGVFRPRWAREVFPGTGSQHQYIDGGVMDNLPVDAVAEYLYDAARVARVNPRPGAAPHLMFCASLEEQQREPDGATLDGLRHNWPRLLRQAKRLGYNEKLHLFARTQANVRGLTRNRVFGPDAWQPLDLEVVTVLPQWLCSTFGFHPMLGFRRRKQAESIAHGCAATLHRLAETWRGWQGRERANEWHIDTDRLPQGAVDAAGRVPLKVIEGQAGHCWFQPKHLCPFSPEGQNDTQTELLPNTQQRLADIYLACHDPRTHQPRP